MARVESKTVICSQKKEDAIPTPGEGVKGSVGHWADPAEMEVKLKELFNGCMAGKANNLPFWGLSKLRSARKHFEWPIKRRDGSGLGITDEFCWVACNLRTASATGDLPQETCYGVTMNIIHWSVGIERDEHFRDESRP